MNYFYHNIKDVIMCFKFKLLGDITTNYMKAKDHNSLLFNTE